MKKSTTYSVAGHSFSISLPDGFEKEGFLEAYSPFAECLSEPAEIALDIQFVDNLKSVSDGTLVDVYNDEAPYFWLFEKPASGGWYFGFSNSKRRVACLLMVENGFDAGYLYLRKEASYEDIEFAVSNSMMLLYAFRNVEHGVLLTHASVVVVDGEGYMFLGKSGTGKSTHSRLWMENIPGAMLLNDDNPILKIVDGVVMVYGSPWSGKTHCYKNMAFPLKAVVRLSQAGYNKIVELPLISAYASLLSSCSSMRWDRHSLNCLYPNVEAVVKKVKGWHLECLPDADAALICHSACSK